MTISEIVDPGSIVADPVIEVRGLTKTFRRHKTIVEAVAGIDLTVRRGELVALLGPNGAGKSTTLRMLTTLLQPTAGTALLAGRSVVDEPDEVRRRIGYVGQGNGAGHNQRVREELIMQGRCYGLSKIESVTRAVELVDALDLGELVDRRVGTLSGGQRRRLDIALGIVHRPEIIFLDEPTTGMDPQSRANLWDHIGRLREQTGATIILTTHYLDEADAMAERVVVIDHGTVIADDSATALKANLAGDRIALTVEQDTAAIALADLAGDNPAVDAVVRRGATVTLRVTRSRQLLAELITLAAHQGITVTAAEATHPTLDDVFLGLTGRSLRESATAA
ncbi:ABC transporter ATP-binding protein [Williamsia sterculiae]|uniref:ABC-2 type transport system ATP-binding protein n=1 Tax=Williamsia sterculiae TaxID=1344003 RepID=A0A1N7G8U2_9NOCA|nr:ATP-binding cassette domain-containing protein [Williamsia sterculiae]SIS09000.1 ABC-2 type transport system ATP-binding protein [Williamsia sterculiae]